MAVSKNNFNFVASFYDQLAKLAFGNTISTSQIYFLDKIPANSRILIAGGGTGFILEAVLMQNKAKEILYIDSSLKMIERAKKRIEGQANSSKVRFLTAEVEEVDLVEQFDVVITNYFLDLFTEEKLCLIISKLNEGIAKGGIWLVTDFSSHHDQKIWQKLWIRMMYLFFRITANIEGRQLLDLNNFITQANFIKTDSKFFFSGMIQTSIFKKNGLN